MQFFHRKPVEGDDTQIRREIVPASRHLIDLVSPYLPTADIIPQEDLVITICDYGRRSEHSFILVDLASPNGIKIIGENKSSLDRFVKQTAEKRDYVKKFGSANNDSFNYIVQFAHSPNLDLVYRIFAHPPQNPNV